MPSKKSYLSGWFVDTEYPNSSECSKVQGDAGIYGSLLLGMLITFQETKQECSRDVDGSGRGGTKNFLVLKRVKRSLVCLWKQIIVPLHSKAPWMWGVTHHGLHFWPLLVLLEIWSLEVGQVLGNARESSHLVWTDGGLGLVTCPPSHGVLFGLISKGTWPFQSTGFLFAHVNTCPILLWISILLSIPGTSIHSELCRTMIRYLMQGIFFPFPFIHCHFVPYYQEIISRYLPPHHLGFCILHPAPYQLRSAMSFCSCGCMSITKAPCGRGQMMCHASAGPDVTWSMEKGSRFVPRKFFKDALWNRSNFLPNLLSS